MKLEPPTFSHAKDPLQADDWIKVIKKKLDIIQCNDRERVLYASGHLMGQATDWWDAYTYAHEDPQRITWQEFRRAFRTHHVPTSVIKLKKKEFQDLKQGNKLVNQYLAEFTQLSRYAPDAVDTDEKK